VLRVLAQCIFIATFHGGDAVWTWNRAWVAPRRRISVSRRWHGQSAIVYLNSLPTSNPGHLQDFNTKFGHTLRGDREPSDFGRSRERRVRARAERERERERISASRGVKSCRAVRKWVNADVFLHRESSATFFRVIRFKHREVPRCSELRMRDATNQQRPGTNWKVLADTRRRENGREESGMANRLRSAESKPQVV